MTEIATLTPTHSPDKPTDLFAAFAPHAVPFTTDAWRRLPSDAAPLVHHERKLQ